jgi:hypothetical protein
VIDEPQQYQKEVTGNQKRLNKEDAAVVLLLVLHVAVAPLIFHIMFPSCSSAWCEVVALEGFTLDPVIWRWELLYRILN